MYWPRNIKRFTYCLALTAFFVITVFAPLSMMSMGHHEMGMSQCPFMLGEAALCQMNAFDHIASWQTMFTVPSSGLSYFILLLLTLVLLWVSLRHLVDPPDIPQGKFHPSYSSNTDIFPFPVVLFGTVLNPRAP